MTGAKTNRHWCLFQWNLTDGYEIKMPTKTSSPVGVISEDYVMMDGSHYIINSMWKKNPHIFVSYFTPLLMDDEQYWDS